MTARTHLLRRLLAGGTLAAAITILPAGLAVAVLPAGRAGAAGSSPVVPPPRTTSLTPRITPLAPRITTLQARVVSVAPQQTAPNTVSINSDVLFAFDSSTLSADAQAVLGAVVDQLDGAPAGAVMITGYTDSIGTQSYNLTLSQQRAAAVQAYLQANVTNGGLTYESQGMGEADPVAPNTNPNGTDNPAGRAQNRRVTVTLPT